MKWALVLEWWAILITLGKHLKTLLEMKIIDLLLYGGKHVIQPKSHKFQSEKDNLKARSIHASEISITV